MNITIRRCATALAMSCLAAAAWGQQSTPPGNDSATVHRHATGTQSTQGNVMQSGAMQDAMGVAQQAFGFAVRHPDATDADKKAAADAFMSGIFSHELDGAATQLPPATRKPGSSTTHKDYGNAGDGDD